MEEGNSNPLQCSCLENPRDGGAWWATVSGVAQSQTRLKRLSSSCSITVFKRQIKKTIAKQNKHLIKIMFETIFTGEHGFCRVWVMDKETGVIHKLLESRHYEFTDIKSDEHVDFPGGPVVKNLSANAGDTGSTPGPGRFHVPQGNEA